MGDAVRVLVVDEDPLARRAVLRLVTTRGFVACGVQGVVDVAPTLDEREIDVVACNVEIGRDGIRAVLVYATGSLDQRAAVDAFGSGADDVTRNALDDMCELETRLRILSQRGPRSVHDSTAVVGDIEIDIQMRRIFIRGRPLRVSKMQFRLVVAFVTSRRPLSYPEIDRLLGYAPNAAGRHHRVIQAMSRLRARLGEAAPLLHTIDGGYCLDSPG